MSYGLTKRIFKHALSEGWLKKGDVVVDPFGGIGSTGIIGAYQGLRVVCVELEPKFVDLANQNFSRHKKKLDAFRHFGHSYQPQIIQGDSRKLSEVMATCKESLQVQNGADCVIGSPPFSGGTAGGKAFAELARKWNSNPDNINKPGFRPNCADGYNRPSFEGDYGQTPGQLGQMKPGSVDAVVSSPPYAESEVSSKGQSGIDIGNVEAIKAKRKKQRKDTPDGYGSKGNLGNLKPGEVDGIISSPPYEGSLQSGCPESKWELTQKCIRDGKGHASKKLAPSVGVDYGKADGQLGNDKGETFWQAARQIVSECHNILKPGGHAIFVVKAFVRKGAIVDFPSDWRRLCESQGFQTVHEHHAMLVKETRHDGLFEEIVEVKEKKSFFRRLAEKKGSPRIDYEVVLCTVKI